ncbi:unnamed protein product, partial [Medioppia subpectinata]
WPKPETHVHFYCHTLSSHTLRTALPFRSLPTLPNDTIAVSSITSRLECASETHLIPNRGLRARAVTTTGVEPSLPTPLKMSEIVAKEEEESWVLDSLVGFLRGPVWNLTIQSFIENKSVADSVCEVFEDNAPEECVREYDVIFQDYKRLVDRL